MSDEQNSTPIADVNGASAVSTIVTLGECLIDFVATKAGLPLRAVPSFVSLGTDGERTFLFYRDAVADLMLDGAALDAAYIAGAQLLHVGSLSLTEPASRDATQRGLPYPAPRSVAGCRNDARGRARRARSGNDREDQ